MVTAHYCMTRFETERAATDSGWHSTDGHFSGLQGYRVTGFQGFKITVICKIFSFLFNKKEKQSILRFFGVFWCKTLKI
jgi:hypothetical protein